MREEAPIRDPSAACTARSRHLLLAGICATLVGCGAAEAAPPGPDPVQAVQALHAKLSAGDMAGAASSIDHAGELARLLGDAWKDAPEAGRKATLAAANRLFQRSTERYWKAHAAGGPLRLTVRYFGPSRAIVTATPTAAGPDTPVWRYVLGRAKTGWRIRLRETVADRSQDKPVGLWESLVGKARAQLGRAPTLAELQERLPRAATP